MSRYIASMRITLVVAGLMTAGFASGSEQKLSIDPEQITVSGISAGAQMAHQLHIAYPDIFSGAGLIAGGPFGCADGSLATAFARCMGTVSADLPIDQFAQQIESAAADGKLGATRALSNDKVWIFHGALDKTVASELSDVTVSLYGKFIDSENILYVNNIAAGHTFPTADNGVECGITASPFIGLCDYDAAGELLQYLYADLEQPATELKTELVKTTLPGALAAGLDETAYLFVPEACMLEGLSCKAQMVLHGCSQSRAQIDTIFINQSGYLPWAESNNIVLAFPQVVPSAVNPYACWDWWGYTGESYRWRDGTQMKVLADWMQALAIP